MKRVIVTLASTLLYVGTSSAIAESHAEQQGGPKWVPVETWTCDFRDGQTLEDLQGVTAEWNELMDDEGVDYYFAALVLPNYFGEFMFDVGWLGAWKDGNMMGAGVDMWLAKGGEVGDKFNEVCNWKSHTNFASTNIKSPGDDEEDDKTFVLSFSNCSAKEGKKFDDVMAGMNAWAEYATEHGFQNSIWMMFPVYGESDSDYNFKLLEGHDDHAAFGADYELMGNGGHWRKNSEMLNDLIDCDIARVYDGMTVRDWADEDDG